jgi:pectin methylesterase-like acyl-CoA thioesterase
MPLVAILTLPSSRCFAAMGLLVLAACSQAPGHEAPDASDGVIDAAAPEEAGAPGTVNGGIASTSGTDGGAANAPVPDAGAARQDAGSAPIDAGALDPNEGPLAGALVFPAPGATGTCRDPPLRITFPSPPKLGTAGTIEVHDAAAAVVARVDMSAASYKDTIGGLSLTLPRPVFVDGNDIVVRLPANALGYGQTYSVSVDSGALLGPGGAPFAVSGATAWSFTTRAAAPANLAALAVSLNGAGDFCTVQGALDAVPAGASVTALTLAVGTYHEVVHAASKANLTIHGSDRKSTIIAGTNNNDLNPSTTTRSLVGIDSSTGVVIENLTIQNTTPQGGSQAEALRLQSCDKCIVRDADILSLQDTLLWSGRLYAENCYVAGNVDFVWGTGAAYFKGCEIHTVGTAGAVVQARNGASGYGYVFVDSTLTADSTVSGQVLARIDTGSYPASQVAYVNCTMGPFIAPAGWTITGVGGTAQLRFGEYESVDPTGKPVDTSHRAVGSTQIAAAQAMSMRDPSVVLGGWTP